MIEFNTTVRRSTLALMPALIALLAWRNLSALGGWETFAALFDAASTWSLDTVILTHAWSPRVLMALLAGAGLALSGALLQQILRNPLASPLTIGVSGGAQLALSLGILLVPAFTGQYAEWVAFAGGMSALGLVVAMSWRRGLEPVTVVLSGMVVGLYVGAINGGLLLFFEYDLKALLIWSGGALAQHGWQESLFLGLRLIFAFIATILLIRPLTMLTLDDASARSLGVSLIATRILGLGLAVYLIACVVSVVGVVAFVGLAAPAMARMLGARTVAVRFLVATLVGAVLLLFADQFVQWLGQYTAELLPTGAFTALLGAPLLLWLLRQVRGIPIPEAQMLAEPRQNRFIWFWIALAGAAILLIALCVGKYAGEWRALAPWAVMQSEPWQLPRIWTSAAAGLLLGVAGVILQRLLGNPLASPEVLGISGGAMIGVVVLLYFAPGAGGAGLVVSGSAGALATIGLLMLFAREGGVSPIRLVLAGIGIKAVFEGTIALVAASGSPFWVQLLTWISGSTYGAGSSEVTMGAVGILLVLPPALLLHRWLDILSLGSENATARGLHLPLAHGVLLLLAAIATATATLLVGWLSFAGLMAPHLARLMGLRRAASHLFGAALVGMLLMVLADWLGRNLIAPYEVPAGLAASVIGGAYFMWLVARRNNAE